MNEFSQKSQYYGQFFLSGQSIEVEYNKSVHFREQIEKINII